MKQKQNLKQTEGKSPRSSATAAETHHEALNSPLQRKVGKPSKDLHGAGWPARLPLPLVPTSCTASQRFGDAQLQFHALLQDTHHYQTPLQPHQQGPTYQISHPQHPARAEEHADALHKPTIRDPLMEMDDNLRMIKTQLTAVGRYSRLCKGAVQMRSYQDLRCPKHLSILG